MPKKTGLFGGFQIFSVLGQRCPRFDGAGHFHREDNKRAILANFDVPALDQAFLWALDVRQ
jgi:hypothetical protein